MRQPHILHIADGPGPSSEALSPGTRARTATTGGTPTGDDDVAIVPSPAKKSRYVIDRADLEVVKKLMTAHETVQLNNRERVLRGSKPNVGPCCNELAHEPLVDRHCGAEL